MSTDLANRVALVTGASAGLGAQFARVLAREGARVAIAARRTDRLAALAAEITNAGGIALPLAIPGIIATGIYIFLTAWDELMFAWVLTNADTMTIPVGIRLFVGNYQNRFDLMMAAATVATLPVVVIFFLLQKHIVHGLTAGAVKG